VNCSRNKSFFLGTTEDDSQQANDGMLG